MRNSATRSALAAVSVVLAIVIGRLVPAAAATGGPPERAPVLARSCDAAVSPAPAVYQDDDTGDDTGDDGGDEDDS